MEYTHIVHPFGPLYDSDSEILILGSLPSVKSREQNFFYGHPQNRFWKMLAMILGEENPVSVDEKRRMVLKHHIAMWDSIKECDIKGSSDASIKNVVPNDIKNIIDNSKIKTVICNGKSSGAVYQKYLQPMTGIESVVMPSTSPANAAWSIDKLAEEWSRAINNGFQTEREF